MYTPGELKSRVPHKIVNGALGLIVVVQLRVESMSREPKFESSFRKRQMVGKGVEELPNAFFPATFLNVKIKSFQMTFLIEMI